MVKRKSRKITLKKKGTKKNGGYTADPKTLPSLVATKKDTDKAINVLISWGWSEKQAYYTLYQYANKEDIIRISKAERRYDVIDILEKMLEKMQKGGGSKKGGFSGTHELPREAVHSQEHFLTQYMEMAMININQLNMLSQEQRGRLIDFLRNDILNLDEIIRLARSNSQNETRHILRSVFSRLHGVFT